MAVPSNTAVNTHTHAGFYAFISVCVSLGAELLSRVVTVDLFKELPACFPKGLGRFTFPLEEGSSSSFLSLFKSYWRMVGLQYCLSFGCKQSVSVAHTHAFILSRVFPRRGCHGLSGFPALLKSGHPGGHEVASCCGFSFPDG